jgi:hypothetical protein
MEQDIWFNVLEKSFCASEIERRNGRAIPVRKSVIVGQQMPLQSHTYCAMQTSDKIFHEPFQLFLRSLYQRPFDSRE